MKIITRLISAALFLIAAAACNLSEINNPDDPNNNGSGKKAYSITAKIIQTRVLYTDGAVLKQEWETGDRLIGYYKLLISTGSGTIAQPTPISFKVKNIIGGIANLELESGTLPEDGTKIALIYDPYGNSDFSSLPLSVDLTNQSFDIGNQSTTVLPAFMSASAVYTKADGAEFVFQNDCAIIEVDGIYKTGKPSESEINSVSSIKIENVIALGSYTFNPSEGKFSLSGSGTGAVTVSCNRTLVWETGVLDKPVFLAVIPTEAERAIDVTFSDGTTNCKVEEYGKTAFAPGKCYVIYPKDMVAKTVDNQYFPSVAAAFEHAEYLDGKLGVGVENTVTLVKEEIYGLLEDAPHDAEEDLMTRIRINYPVTLDLNGCTLDLDYWYETDAYDRGGFIVSSNNGHLIVKDNVGKGCIRSVSYCPIIENNGTVDILGGELKNFESSGDFPPVIENHGTLKVMCGKLFSHAGSAIDSNGSLIIGNKENSSTSEYEIDISCESGAEDGTFVPAINCSGGSIDIYDGIVHSLSSSAVNLTGDAIGNLGSLTINGGEIYSETASAIGSNGGAVNITGGYIHADWAEAIQVYGGTNCDISGGIICSEGSGANATIRCYSEGNTISTLTIRWPDGISNPSPNTIQGPIIYSGESDSDSVLPVGTYHPQKENSAKISIVGGYLITNNHLNLFYEDDSGENLMSNESGKLLFGNFYSNQPSITLFFDTTSSNPIDLYNSGNGDEIRNQLFYADPKGSFVLTDIDFSGDLYKIDPVEENDGYPGTDLEPVEIGGVVWAPVNCGYDADHPYGLLYQWGRKYGQGYDENEGKPDLYDFWELGAGQLSTYPDTDISSKNKFYYSVGDTYWYEGTDPASKYLWDKNGHEWEEISLENVEEYYPEKSDFDPCPDGWRIPSAYEFYILAGQRYDGADFELIAPDDEHPTGGAVFYHQVAGLNQEELFLPAAGMRDDSGVATDRGIAGYYWTSSVYESVPWNLTFNNLYTDIINSFFVNGCSIRCVKE